MRIQLSLFAGNDSYRIRLNQDVEFRVHRDVDFCFIREFHGFRVSLCGEFKVTLHDFDPSHLHHSQPTAIPAALPLSDVVHNNLTLMPRQVCIIRGQVNVSCIFAKTLYAPQLAGISANLDSSSDTVVEPFAVKSLHLTSSIGKILINAGTQIVNNKIVEFLGHVGLNLKAFLRFLEQRNQLDRPLFRGVEIQQIGSLRHLKKCAVDIIDRATFTLRPGSQFPKTVKTTLGLAGDDKVSCFRGNRIQFAIDFIFEFFIGHSLPIQLFVKDPMLLKSNSNRLAAAFATLAPLWRLRITAH